MTWVSSQKRTYLIVTTKTNIIKPGANMVAFCKSPSMKERLYKAHKTSPEVWKDIRLYVYVTSSENKLVDLIREWTIYQMVHNLIDHYFRISYISSAGWIIRYICNAVNISQGLDFENIGKPFSMHHKQAWF